MPLKLKIKILSANANQIKKKVAKAVDQALEDARPKIATLFIDRLSQEADKVFSPSTAALYKKGLQDPAAIEITETSISLKPTTPLAEALESGYKGFSIKSFMLSSPSVKKSKEGRPYVDIPFRHGLNEGSQFHGMPSDIKARIKKAVVQKQAALKKAGLTPALIALTPARMPGVTAKLRPSHKSGLYDGLVRIPKKVGKTVTGEYRTFRRISENSDPASWWHPGYKGAKLFSQVLPDLKDQAKKIIQASFQSLGLKVK